MIGRKQILKRARLPIPRIPIPTPVTVLQRQSRFPARMKPVVAAFKMMRKRTQITPLHLPRLPRQLNRVVPTRQFQRIPLHPHPPSQKIRSSVLMQMKRIHIRCLKRHLLRTEVQPAKNLPLAIVPTQPIRPIEPRPVQSHHARCKRLHPPVIALMTHLHRVKRPAKVQPLQRPDQSLIAIRQHLPPHLHIHHLRQTHLHTRQSQIKKIIPFRSIHQRNIRSIRKRLPRILPLHRHLQPRHRFPLQPHPQPMQQPRVIRHCLSTGIKIIHILP